uniref:Tachykinin-related peptide 4 n=1 Tax=Rhyparobia maderae TaxID=36963 RepID=TRP4_RHYMA|nr:RecName: Full=Tachykinin-related peptide 4; Short=LemTRP 4 [Rhyparobia maderae]
APSGFMGMR